MKPHGTPVWTRAAPSLNTGEAADSAERRTSSRFAVSASAEMMEARTRARLSGRASDLGSGGCYIDTVTPFPVGTSLTLKLTSERHSVDANADVVYAHTGMGMGLAFTEMTANQRANLSAWLRELGGESAGEQRNSGANRPFLQQATIREPVTEGKHHPGVLDALRELVSLLGNKRVLTEEEVERLREKMSE